MHIFSTSVVQLRAMLGDRTYNKCIISSSERCFFHLRESPSSQEKSSFARAIINSKDVYWWSAWKRTDDYFPVYLGKDFSELHLLRFIPNSYSGVKDSWKEEGKLEYFPVQKPLKVQLQCVLVMSCESLQGFLFWDKTSRSLVLWDSLVDPLYKHIPKWFWAR